MRPPRKDTFASGAELGPSPLRDASAAWGPFPSPCVPEGQPGRPGEASSLRQRYLASRLLAGSVQAYCCIGSPMRIVPIKIGLLVKSL